MQLRPGERIDHYRLVKLLGRGGQGSVWEVIDPRDGGIARALKLVRLDEAGPKSFDRARREAKILAAARHPALVACHGFFEDLGAGLVGLVMDLVPGGSLDDATREGRLDRAHAFAALEQIASVLAYMHNAGLVHRDLKPDNVLLAEGFWAAPRAPGMVKLVDFGIAAPAGNPRPLTSQGGVVGTVPYLAPELVDPATWGRAEGPTRDLFAFGVLAWEVLFHKHPTGLGPHASIVDHARAYKAADAGRLIAWPPPGLDGRWGNAVGRCLALRAAERPVNGAALVALLDGAAPSTAAPRPAPTAPHRPARGGTSPTPSLTAQERAPAAAPVPTAPHFGPGFTAVATALPAPAEAQPTQVMAVSGAPHPRRSTRATPAPRRESWVLLLVVFIVAVTVVVGLAVTLHLVPTSVPPTPSSLVLAPPSVAPLPVAPSPEKPSSAPLPVSRPLAACCRSESMCKGPTRLSCPACDARKDPDPLPAGERFWLRAGGLLDARKHDMTGTRPSSVLCMRTGESRACVPFKTVGSRRVYDDDRLQITTEDLYAGRVRVSIDGGPESTAHVSSTPVLVSALCAGLRMYADDGQGGTMTLSVYLDPVAEQGP